jgi:S-adenosylmethionine synthetase
MSSYLWTSEAVAAGHPDKTADQIADAILDAHLSQDPEARVASEVTILKDFVLLSGEITSKADVDPVAVTTETLKRIGYDRPEHGFDVRSAEIVNKITTQSSQISQAVTKDNGEIGAGDQGLMFGFACNETETFMPLSHQMAFHAINLHQQDLLRGRLEQKAGEKPRIGSRWDSPLRPDAKSQVTLAYENGRPSHVHTLVFSTCHQEQMTISDLHGYVNEMVLRPLRDSYPTLFTDKTKYLINPAGLWTVGGPAADTGLSGRKIVVDNYGADCPIGGGSFSGKDPTKVDRSGAYAARWVAKNIVSAGFAERATVQVSYAIGVVQPISVRVIATGSKVPYFLAPPVAGEYAPDSEASELLGHMVMQTVDLSPKGIIEALGLRRPIYAATASGGHFGRNFPWEKTDLVERFREYLSK